MKKNILIISLIFLVTSCNSSRYTLSNNNKEDKNYVKNYIKNNIEIGEINSKPLIVLDGTPLIKPRLSLKRENIEKLGIMDVKSNSGRLIWEEYAENGVVLITTNLIPKKEFKTIDESDILFFLNGKKIGSDEIKNIDNNNVQTIEVIKSNDKIKLFNGEKYDGVMIIKLK